MALPTLECMLNGNGTAYAQGGDPLPRRYAIVFAGQALGGDNWPQDRFQIAGQRITEAGHFIAPPEFGSGYTLTTPLLPLAHLTRDFNIVTGLRIPYNASSTDGGTVPPGGAFRDFHGGGASPLLSGVRSTSASFRAEGTSSDQVVASLAVNKGKTSVDSLVLRSQPSWYLAGSSYAGRQYISYAGRREPIEAQTNPQTAYNALFSNFRPSGQAQSAQGEFNRRAELSVLSLVRERRDALLGRVGRADRMRLEEHFDRIRDLEQRILTLPTNQTATCSKPPAPGGNWYEGANNAGSGGSKIATNTGYSDETRRAQVQADLIHMALTCDLTRVATLQVTVFQSHMNVYPVSEAMGTPILADLHEVGHNGDPENRGQKPVSLMLQWHIQTYARLVDNLKNTPEGAGSVLDNCAIVFMNEAGHGRQLNDATSDNQSHSVENMQLMVAGRAGGMQPGRHIDGKGRHPGQVLLGAMKAVGFEGDALGEVSGPADDLLVV